jgi:putative methyltransferase (TIGR04325 family)
MAEDAQRVKWKGIIRSMIPPVVLQLTHQLRHGPPPPPEWKIVPGGWENIRNAGWAHPSIAEAQRKKWPRYLNSIHAPAPLAVSHESRELNSYDVSTHNILMSYAYVLARAAVGQKMVSLLDWGCGAGHYYPLSKELLPDADIEYHGYDLPHLIALARELNPGVAFHERKDECLASKYDLVLASGSFQYEIEWRDLLGKMSQATTRYLFITRLPLVIHSPAFVLQQQVRAYGYDTEYGCWVFNRQEFLEQARNHGLILDREFLMFVELQVEDVPESIQHRGFLFRKAA